MSDPLSMDSMLGPTVSLNDCIKLWAAVETLTADDAWYCRHCKKPREATKQLDLRRLPQILVIHLKRFSMPSGIWSEKITSMVDFPLTGLDLSDFDIDLSERQPPIYDLVAISVSNNLIVVNIDNVQNHQGGLGSGHYTAVCKNPSDGKWYKYDDRTVSEVAESNVKTRHAYILFYQRRKV